MGSRKKTGAEPMDRRGVVENTLPCKNLSVVAIGKSSTIMGRIDSQSIIMEVPYAD